MLLEYFATWISKSRPEKMFIVPCSIIGWCFSATFLQDSSSDSPAAGKVTVIKHYVYGGAYLGRGTQQEIILWFLELAMYASSRTFFSMTSDTTSSKQVSIATSRKCINITLGSVRKIQKIHVSIKDALSSRSPQEFQQYQAMQAQKDPPYRCVGN